MILTKATQHPILPSRFFKYIPWLLGMCFLLFTGSARAQSVACPPNLDFEQGNYNNWVYELGYAVQGTPSTGVKFSLTGPGPAGPAPWPMPIPTTNPPYYPWASPQFTRFDTTTALISPNDTDFYGGFKINPAGGGSYAMKIGSDTPYYSAERMTYYIHVPPGFNDYSLNFRYAIVLYDGGHAAEDQPTFRIQAYDSADATKAPLPCAFQNYVASPQLIPLGFKVSPRGSAYYYLPWTGTALPIINQCGKTIAIEVSALGCDASGHWAYGYFDVISCGKYKAAVSYCNLDSGIVRFIGTGITQSYNWYTSNWTFVGSGAYVDVAIPSTPDFFYGVLPNASSGCLDTIKTDTVSNFLVDAKPDITCARFGNPIQITTTITGGVPGGFTTSWLPSPDLSSITITNPIATPVDTTHYVVTVSDKVGCFRHDTVYIKQAPNAGPDLPVCPLGERPVQLHAGGPIGVNYHWYENDPSLPAGLYLDCTDCTKPVSAPEDPVHTYLLGYDNCPTLDTIVVYHDTATKIEAPQDPLIVCRPSYVNLISNPSGPSPYLNIPCGIYNPIVCLPQDQDTATIGFGAQPAAKVNNTPFYSEKRYVKYQFIIPKRDLLNSGFYSGTINSLAFKTINTATLGGVPMDFFTLNLGCVPFDTFSRSSTGKIDNQSFVTGTTQVGAWSGLSTIPNDWNQLDFATPYSWDTSMNLLVDICVGPMTVPNSAGLGNDPVAMTDGVSIQKADDIINVCGGNATTFYEYYQRPVIRFNYCPTPVLPFDFTWKPGTYLNDSNAQNPTVYVSDDIKYAVYTIGRNGCRVRDSLTITVPDHKLNLWAQDTFACVQQPVYMHASGADAYQWFEYQGGVFADASGSLSCTKCDNPTAMPKVTTTYAVVFTNNVHQSNPINANYETGCPDTLFTTINIWPLPNVVATNRDTTILFGKKVQLYAKGAARYSWTPVGSLSDPNSPAPIAAPTTTTNYVVSGMDTNGCVSRDTVTVFVNYNDNLLIPSAFTPNGDGRNDEFRIVNATFQRLMEFRVFNRWGQEVFSTTDINKGWDGTWKGVAQDMGTYQYLIRVAYPDGRVETYKGDVSIVK